MRADAAIALICERLQAEPAVEALFLSGSHASGWEDDYSDIDFVLVSTQGATDEIVRFWHQAISAVGEIVLWRDRKVGPTLVNAITEDWDRIDVVIRKPSDLTGQAKSELKVLFDRNAIYATLADPKPAAMPAPERLRYQCEEFIRVLGLLHVALGRGEFLNGVTGVFHLRNLLVDLLIAETNAPNRGGALHLNRLIDAKQKQFLASLPIPSPDREQLVEAHMAYARAYLPRAKRLLLERGGQWPERFEAITWKRLRLALGDAIGSQPADGSEPSSAQSG